MRQPACEVVTTARLHLGFLDLEGGLQRRFGSVGLSLDAPRTAISVARAALDTAEDQTDADRTNADRALPILRAMARHLGLDGGHHVTVRAAMPAHAGLGSGTQLALAIAAGLRGLHGLPPDPRGDACATGRGRRSGIGIGLFAHGGLVVDGGPGPDGAPPPLLSRLAVPDDWRVILVMDRARAGLSGEHESTAFATLPPMRASDPGALCRLLLMRVLPALVEDDLERFGDGLTRMQELLGDHFAPSQGGARFTSARVGAAVGALRAAGATGVGQTSWGPTGFAFARGEARADALIEAVRPRHGEGLDFLRCRALNRGAAISTDLPGQTALEQGAAA